jgi:hypothetical protein
LSVATQAVDCIDLSYRFATDLAADRVNRSIAPGEMYGPLGPNGIHDQDDHHAADPGATILSITCASLLLPSLANR